MVNGRFASLTAVVYGPEEYFGSVKINLELSRLGLEAGQSVLRLGRGNWLLGQGCRTLGVSDWEFEAGKLTFEVRNRLWVYQDGILRQVS